jgi:NitT/TauT family transport system ATP-binding protein
VAAVAIELVNVSRTFEGTEGRPDVQALQDVSLRIFEGEFVSLVGPSGCGKSTVLNLLAMLARPSAGQILVRGETLRAMHPDVGYVFQRDTLLPWRTVLDNVLLGPELRGVPREARLRAATGLIRKVGLASFEHHYPHELSGGMRKRCELIRTLINRPSILLMDEPFGALDAQTRYLLQEDLLRMWREERSTIVFVTHDIGEAIALSDRVVVMSRRPGRILKDVQVRLPRPRSATDAHASPEYSAHFQEIWGLLRDQLVEL